jgi:hypothetical protein
MWLALMGCQVLLLPGLAGAAQTGAPAYWLGGVDSVVREDRHASDPADYMQLFQPDSPWQKGASRVTVFKISMQFASRSNEADLATLITDLRRRRIGLAIEMGMLRNDRGCGKGEGYMQANLPGVAMKRIQRLGGEVKYIAMDEVVFFGHERNWPKNSIPPCKQPALAPLKAGLVARAIRFGVIVGGDPDFTDDVAWTRAGLHQLTVLHADPATTPQDIVIQSWQPLPTHYLPETTPGTTTWMLLEAEKL